MTPTSSTRTRRMLGAEISPESVCGLLAVHAESKITQHTSAYRKFLIFNALSAHRVFVFRLKQSRPL